MQLLDDRGVVQGEQAEFAVEPQTARRVAAELVGHGAPEFRSGDLHREGGERLLALRAVTDRCLEQVAQGRSTRHGHLGERRGRAELGERRRHLRQFIGEGRRDDAGVDGVLPDLRRGPRVEAVQRRRVGRHARAQQRVVERRRDARDVVTFDAARLTGRSGARRAEGRGADRHRYGARVPAGLVGEVGDVVATVTLAHVAQRTAVHLPDRRLHRFVLTGQRSPGGQGDIEFLVVGGVVADGRPAGHLVVHKNRDLKVSMQLLPVAQLVAGIRGRVAARGVGLRLRDRPIAADIPIDHLDDETADARRGRARDPTVNNWL